MKNIIQEFKDFAIKGNAIDLAIAVVIGAAFTNIVNSIVSDLINPLISLLSGAIDFSNRFIVLNATSTKQYTTLAEAKADGVATLNYGLFINNVINFLIVSFVIFIIVRQVSKLRRKDDAEKAAVEKAEEKKV
jgi:large conductance mechanosensitive channel